MRLLTRSRPGAILLAASAAAAAVIAVPGTASAAVGASPVVGHVYVNDNTAGTNTIGVFDRHADGTLTPHAGSPFAAGGAGTGAGLASQGALQISPNGRFLLAVDAGSNQISVLRIKPNGSLRQVPGGIIASGGVLPVSVAIHRALVYVANAGTGGSNYTGFRLGRGGRLHPLAGSRRLTAAPGSPFPAQGLGPFGSEFRPTNPRQLFVSNAHDGAGAGTVSAFRDSANGTLTSIGSSPFADNQTAPCWVEITPDGRFLFTTNTASGTISRYWISPRGRLRLLGSTPARGTGVGVVDLRLSPDSRFLYVDEIGAGAVAAFTVHGGNLTELASSPAALPAGAAPAGIVVT